MHGCVRVFFFFQAEDGIRDVAVTGVQTCALPIFSDGATWKEIPYRKGKIFWASFSAELAEGLDAAASVYGYVLDTLKIKPPFEWQSALPADVLISATELQDSVQIGRAHV